MPGVMCTEAIVSQNMVLIPFSTNAPLFVCLKESPTSADNMLLTIKTDDK